MADDFNFDVDLDIEGTEVAEEEKDNATTASQESDLPYPVMEEGDGKFVKIPVDEFEELKQGSMRAEDYTAKTQTVSALTEKLRETIAALEGDLQDSEGNDINVDDVDFNNPTSAEDLQKRIEELVNERVAPVYEAEARRAIEEETKAFKEKYSFIFTGDKQKDDEIMSQIYLTAATYSHSDGSPLSLEEAFAVAFKDDLLNTTSLLVQKERERRKLWGAEANTNTGANEPVVASEEDADRAFQEKLMALRGY